MTTGARLSDLFEATTLSISDVLYIVNELAPRKVTIETLIAYLISGPKFAQTVNNIAATDGNITLTKDNLGLGNVPNVSPVETLNSLDGNITISDGDNIDISIVGQSITISLNPDLELDFSKISGDYSSNANLSAVLASVGVQNVPRTIDADTGSLELLATDTTVVWVAADFGVDTVLTLGQIGTVASLPIGAMIEIRQVGMGLISVVASDGFTYISTPNGAWNTTDGPGTRIQLVYLGGDAWEYR